MIDGVPHLRMALVPDDVTKYRYKHLIDDKTLDRSLTESGIIFLEYPSAYVIPLSTNPEGPTTLVLCNFDGSNSRLKHILTQQAQEIKELQKVNSALEGRIEFLIAEIKRFRRKEGEIGGRRR